jgi:hypothetical protein
METQITEIKERYLNENYMRDKRALRGANRNYQYSIDELPKQSNRSTEIEDGETNAKNVLR